MVNIEANPECEITVKGKTKPMHARRLEDAEREEAWLFMQKTWPNYKKYEERTDRQIKVFLLTPR